MKRLLAIVATGALLALAVIIAGRSSWAAASDFFVSPQPTMAAAIAVSELTVVATAAILFAVAAAGTLATVYRRRPRWRARMFVGAAVLAAGLAVLAVGLDRHLAPAPVTLGGGSVREASQAIAR